MLIQESSVQSRSLFAETIECDFAVVGGGMAGLCAALAAARSGLRVALMQDRPVLGGNASSECRLWILGATCHMGAPNRWAREGGLLDEILVENMWRNPEGNPIVFESLLLELAAREPNLTLLLNTACLSVEKNASGAIAAIRGFNAQNGTLYEVRAPLFCDASGDGIMGYLAGAAFRVGAEDAEEFGESLAPGDDFGSLLGHTVYYYAKDEGKPVRYTPPAFAMPIAEVEALPRGHLLGPKTRGCHLWWLEYGGRLDTVRQSEEIKWKLWEVVYGIWDYIKNSGRFPEAETLTLEWVGHIPGKRESRRFEGHTMLRQRDIIEQRTHHDAVAFGGWSLDLHPADGLFAKGKPATHGRSKGVYQIPLRCLVSRDVSNLFFAGRIIGASHVAFGSTRVMATGASCGEAVGVAAYLCTRQGLSPFALSEAGQVEALQRALQRRGQFIPGLAQNDPSDLARRATLKASSELRLKALPADGPWLALDRDRGQTIPLESGTVPAITVRLKSDRPANVAAELRVSEKEGNFTYERLLGTSEVALEGGEREVRLNFNAQLQRPAYVLLKLVANASVSVRCSTQRVTGVLSVIHRYRQGADEGAGLDVFDIWTPERRPDGWNWAFALERTPNVFGAGNVVNRIDRPTTGPNAWVADFGDRSPSLTLTWDAPQRIGRVELAFDTDFDHPMESVQYGHPERAMPFCVKRYRIAGAKGETLAERNDNHKTRNTIVFERPVTTGRLTIELIETHGDCPKALFGVRCYAEA